MVRKRECRGGMKKGKIAAIAAVLCGMVLLAGCGEKGEEIPMGRYADREVKMPAGTFDYVHPCPDGSFYLYGTEAALTYVDAEGAGKEHSWGWENTANIHVKYYVGVADNGAAVFAYSPKFYTDEELEAYWLEGDTRWMYYYVVLDGRVQQLCIRHSDSCCEYGRLSLRCTDLTGQAVQKRQ